MLCPQRRRVTSDDGEGDAGTDTVLPVHGTAQYVPSAGARHSSFKISDKVNQAHWRWKAAATAQKKRQATAEDQRSRLSKNSASTPFNDAYFFLLDSSMLTVGLAMMVTYSAVIALMALPLVIATHAGSAPLDDEQVFDGSEIGPVSKIFVFTTTNVITMGWGVVAPHTTLAYVWGTIQQFVGILCNVTVFSVAITKFQRAVPDIIFSQNCLITSRDGVPHLLCRIGNLRCNFLYHPQIMMSLLESRETDEGESFMQTHVLSLSTTPSVISGVFTLAHTIDESSPLLRLALAENHEEEGHGMVVSLVMVARDAVYQQDIEAIKRYSVDKGHVLRGFRFKDCMVMDASSGLPRVDFGLFDLVVPCPASSQSCSSMHSIESTVCEAPGCTAPMAASAITSALGQVSKSTPPAKDSAESAVRGIPTQRVVHPAAAGVSKTEKESAVAAAAADHGRDQRHINVCSMWPPSEGDVEPEWVRDVLYIIHGGYRLGAGLPVVPVCGFTTQVLGIVQGMGLAWTYISIDLDKKPAWFTRKFKAAQTPSVVYNDATVEDSNAIIEWLPKAFPEAARRVYVPEVTSEGLEKGVMGLVMGTLFPVLSDTTNNTELQGEVRRQWGSALEPLEKALQAHGTLGVDGVVSVGDYRAAAFLSLTERIAPLLPGELRNLDVYSNYPNIAQWMGHGAGMRARMVSVSASDCHATLAITQSSTLPKKMPGLMVHGDVASARLSFLRTHSLLTEGSHAVESEGVAAAGRPSEADRGFEMVPKWMVDARLLPVEANSLHQRMLQHDVDVSLLSYLDDAGWKELGVGPGILRSKLLSYFTQNHAHHMPPQNPSGDDGTARWIPARLSALGGSQSNVETEAAPLTRASSTTSAARTLSRVPSQAGTAKPTLLRRKSTADFCI